MGMFDEKKYLTGSNGLFKEGDTFFLHEARHMGKVNIGGQLRDEVELVVSATPNGDPEQVYTSGTAIVGQVDRMDASDRAKMPFQVRIETLEAKPGQNPANILRPVS